jgi:hypothetical protein
MYGLLKVTHHSARWGTPVLTLGAYLRFWSIVCFGVTMWLIFVQKEVGSLLSFRGVHQANGFLLAQGGPHGERD